MSSESSAVDVVQAAYAAFGRGDVPAIVALLGDDPEWKFIGNAGLAYTGSFRGKEQIANWFARIPEVDEILAFEPREFISGGDHVTVLGMERTRAQPSGREFEAEWVHVFTVRGGRIVRFWGMYDTEAAAKARG